MKQRSNEETKQRSKVGREIVELDAEVAESERKKEGNSGTYF